MRKPNSLDSRDTGSDSSGVPLVAPRGSSPGLGDVPRGECPGLGSVPFWPGNFQPSEKVHKLVLAGPLASSGPSRCPRTPQSNPRMSIGCILGVLGFPAPSAHLAGKKKASTIKEAVDWQHYKGGGGLASSCHGGQSASSRERGCCNYSLSRNLKKEPLSLLMRSRTWGIIAAYSWEQLICFYVFVT